ncbi:helix-turn-helix domain-containing protein [Patescibacteria group bacterium]|nr:helix-turn-helix domain-containing protein [Patescibacteria group bacterium]
MRRQGVLPLSHPPIRGQQQGTPFNTLHKIYRHANISISMLLNDIKCMENNNPYLTTKEIAKLFNVRAITIYRWEKKGLIKSHRLNPKGKKLFIKEEILRFIDNNKHSVSSDIKLLDNCDS